MNKKAVVASVMSIATCGSLVAGATYALFTSESKTNIAIQAGKVEVVAWIDDIQTYTFGEEQKANSFALGGSVDYDEESNKLTVERMVPGDGMDFNVYVENKSDIAVSYRVKVAFAGELQSALVASVGLPNTEEATTLTATNVVTDWCSFDDSNSVVLPMSVDFPIGAGNDYQSKSAEIVVTVEAVQANGTDLIMIGNTKYDSLAAATAAASSGDTINLYSGTFTLPTDGSLANKTLTFVGDEYAVIDMKNVNTDQSTTNASLTFDGLTMEFGTENYKGIAHATKVVYKNCTLIGKQFMYAPTVEFSKCDFVNYNDYCVWTYGASKATFTDCTFATGGKAVLVYNEETTSSFVADVTLTNCTFNDDGTLDKIENEVIVKAAVETGSNGKNTETSNKYNLSFKGCTVNGFAPNKSNSALWGNKNDMDADHLKITIDGEPVNIVTNTYTITTAEELKNILTMAGAAGANNSIINLTANVELSEAWTPVNVDGYNGADVITLNGNNHTISGLTAPLFAGGFAGGSGIVINDLTIKDSEMVSTNTQGSGAFIETVDSMDVITLNNCHLKESTITGSRTGGLIGWTSGYNNTNDGAVKTYVTVKNCSVIDCTIKNTINDETVGTLETATESVGAIFGHAGANPWTFTTIENCTVKDNMIIGGSDKTGVILGTANVGEVTISDCTIENNTVNGEASDKEYGRTSFGTTGKLTINGTSVTA